MIKKELLELQKGCKATCAILPTEQEELVAQVTISANASDSELCEAIKKCVENSVKDNIQYFEIKGIDKVGKELQEKYSGFIKDRTFLTYQLPHDTVIILTVESKQTLKKIIPELYKFCVVAF